jgi:hypothetical protein
LSLVLRKMVKPNNIPKMIILFLILWMCQTCQCNDSSKLFGPPLRRLYNDDSAYFEFLSNASSGRFDNNESRHFNNNDSRHFDNHDSAYFKVTSDDSIRHLDNNDSSTFKLVSNVPEHIEVGQPLTLTVSLQNSKATILNCIWTSPKGKMYEKQGGKLFRV